MGTGLLLSYFHILHLTVGFNIDPKQKNNKKKTVSPTGIFSDRLVKDVSKRKKMWNSNGHISKRMKWKNSYDVSFGEESEETHVKWADRPFILVQGKLKTILFPLLTAICTVILLSLCLSRHTYLGCDTWKTEALSIQDDVLKECLGGVTRSGSQPPRAAFVKWNEWTWICWSPNKSTHSLAE